MMLRSQKGYLVHSLLACLNLFVVSSSLQGQEPDYLRAAEYLQSNVHDPVNGVLVSSNPFGTNHAVLNLYKSSQGGIETSPSASLTLPFHRVGGCFEIRSGLFLISGYEFLDWGNYSGKGWLCLVKIELNNQNNALSINLLDSKDLQGIDPVNLIYLKGTEEIVLLNHLDRRLFAATWDGNPGTLPQSFQSVVDESQIPSLRFANILSIQPTVEGDGLRVSDFDVDDYWTVIHGANDQWVVTSGKRTDSNAYIHALGACWISQSISPQFKLSSSTFNGNWELVRGIDDAIIDSGTISTGQLVGMPVEDEYRINPGSSFSYRFNDVNGKWSTFGFFSSARYGSPQSANSLKIGRVYYVGPHSVGSQDFGCGVFVKILQPNVNVSNAYLATAQRNPDGTDPVEIVGDSAILQAQSITNFQLPIGKFNSTVGIRVPIPQDPALDGVVFLYQIVLELDNGESVFSDVMGLRVHPSGGEGVPLTSGYSLKGGGKVQYKKGYLALGASVDGKAPLKVRELFKKIRERMMKMLGK